MRAVPLYLGFGALLSGIVSAALVVYQPETLLWLFILAVLGAIFWWRTQLSGWLLCSVFLILFILGAWRTVAFESQFGTSSLAPWVGERVELEGVVVREPDQRESSLRLFVSVDDELLLVTTDRYAPIKYGDAVLIHGTLAEPAAFTTELGRTFDYPGYLRARGVEFQISFAAVEVQERGRGNPFVAALLAGKEQFLATINEYLPEPTAGLGAGVLLGVKQALGEELERAFRETGIIHIVVLSGYNIMLVVAFITWLLGSFLSPRGTFSVGVVAIGAFALMVGLSATVLRACLMASILLYAEATGRRYAALRALCVAGAVMLLWNPLLLLYDIGFQLSFMATLGLIMLSPYIAAAATFISERFNIRQLLAATVSTQIAVLPLLLYQIGEVSLVGVIVNLLVLPVVPVAMLATFILGISGIVLPAFASVAAWPAYLSLRYIIEIAVNFASWPLAALTVPTFSLSAMLLLYLLYAIGCGWLLSRYPVESLSGVAVDASNDKAGSLAGDAATLDLSEWVIEETSEGLLSSRGGGPSQQTSGTVRRTVPPSDDTPIFFR